MASMSFNDPVQMRNSESIDQLFGDVLNEVPSGNLQYPPSDANNSSSDNRNIEGGSSTDGLDMIMERSQLDKKSNHKYSQIILFLLGLQFFFLSVYVMFCPRN